VKLEAFGLNETAFRDTFEVTAELQEDGTGGSTGSPIAESSPPPPAPDAPSVFTAT